MTNLTLEQIELLNKSVYSSWREDPNTGLINVKGNVVFEQSRLNYFYRELPVSFGEVSGNFIARDHFLETLKGFPIYIGGDCDVLANPLTTIEWQPEYIGGELKIDLRVYANDGQIGYDNDLELIMKMVPSIQDMIAKGIKLHLPDIYYKPTLDIWIEREMIKLL